MFNKPSLRRRVMDSIEPKIAEGERVYREQCQIEDERAAESIKQITTSCEINKGKALDSAVAHIVGD